MKLALIWINLVDTSERQGGAHMGFSEHIDTILNWTESTHQLTKPVLIDMNMQTKILHYFALYWKALAKLTRVFKSYSQKWCLKSPHLAVERQWRQEIGNIESITALRGNSMNLSMEQWQKFALLLHHTRWIRPKYCLHSQFFPSPPTLPHHCCTVDVDS